MERATNSKYPSDTEVGVVFWSFLTCIALGFLTEGLTGLVSAGFAVGVGVFPLVLAVGWALSCLISGLQKRAEG